VCEPESVDDWFICGPGPMMDAAESALLDRGVDRDRIHIERFTADRPSAALVKEIAELQSRVAGVTMAVTLDGRTRRVPFTEENILDSARVAGLPAPFACKAGVCATCRAKLTSGKVEMASRYGLTDEEIEAGYILTCQSVPATDDVAVNYDA
jgi:ring-1,2-phenylacetyl-CoA epoxidase subunit PaaE